MLVPVVPSHGQLRDVWLLGVVILVAERHVFGGSIREGRGLNHLRGGCRRGHDGQLWAVLVLPMLSWVWNVVVVGRE